MKFNECLIIPIYNHAQLLNGFIGELLLYKIPIILVDDGSSECEKVLLRKIAENEGVTVFFMPHNQGKGAALMFGFKQAFENKFSHALQIDADNQHCAGDIPEFLELARSNPRSLINGHPVFDETVPKSRLWGRKITNFWVRLETLSFKITDSMCGFRVYPLEETIKVINKHKISNQMGFDIEIIVKLFWSGVDIVSKKTIVTYPKNGVSHFKIFRDNLAISALHAKLFFTMIAISPLLIIKRLSKLNEE